MKDNNMLSVAGFYSLVLLLFSSNVMAGEKAALGADSTEYLSWDGRQTTSEYASRVKLLFRESLDLGNGVKLDLALVPAGVFRMGSSKGEQERATRAVAEVGLNLDFSDEGPQHDVVISKPFLMGIYEVTMGQFAAFANDSAYRTDAEKQGWAYSQQGRQWCRVDGASWRKPGYETKDNLPVSCVSYKDAQAFCEWASKKTGRTVRLPTEAEWEYACRVGSVTAFPWGDSPDDGKGWCNGVNESGRKSRNVKMVFGWDDGYLYPAPCGSFKANRFGLFDMIGNVWEWCEDGYQKDYYQKAAKVDPKGVPESPRRVVRGGGWDSVPWRCRPAARFPMGRDERDYSVGFRVAVTIK